MKVISKVDISEQGQASRRIPNLWEDWAFLLAIDDLGPPQVHGFDHQDRSVTSLRSHNYKMIAFSKQLRYNFLLGQNT